MARLPSVVRRPRVRCELGFPAHLTAAGKTVQIPHAEILGHLGAFIAMSWEMMPRRWREDTIRYHLRSAWEAELLQLLARQPARSVCACPRHYRDWQMYKAQMSPRDEWAPV